MIDKRMYDWLAPEFKELYASHHGAGIDMVYSLKNTGHHQKRRIDFIGITKHDAIVAIELEHGDDFGQITSGIVQLEDFYDCLKCGIVPRGNNDKVIIPEYFIIMTKYTPEGFLYRNDQRLSIHTNHWDENPWLRLDGMRASIFYISRMMWKMVARDRKNMAEHSPNGLKCFGVMDIEFGKTCVHINNMKVRLGELRRKI